MKTIIAVILAAVPAFAEPPAALAPALRPVVGAAAAAAFKDVRNAAYSKEELRGRVQNAIASRRAVLQAERASGLRERVLEEADEFLAALSPEVDRLARESRDADEFKGRLQGFEAQFRAFAAGAQTRAPLVLTPTAEDIEGPFYRPNAPFAASLAPKGAAGRALTLSGRVLDESGAPVAGALVDVWQADSVGAYDISDPADRLNAKIPLLYRARAHTDAAGRWSFDSVLPGQYEIGEGKWRPRHIHFKVSALGLKRVTTQLYFDGDPYNAADPWFKWSNSTPLTASGAGFLASFDFVLAR